MAVKCSWAKKGAFIILTQMVIKHMSTNLLLNVSNKSEQKMLLSKLVILVVQSDS
jgi:hypothetical protein